MARQRPKIIGVRVTEEEHATITAHAEERGQSVGAFIRASIETALEAEKREKELTEHMAKQLADLTRALADGGIIPQEWQRREITDDD